MQHQVGMLSGLAAMANRMMAFPLICNVSSSCNCRSYGLVPGKFASVDTLAHEWTSASSAAGQVSDLHISVSDTSLYAGAADKSLGICTLLDGSQASHVGAGHERMQAVLHNPHLFANPGHIQHCSGISSLQQGLHLKCPWGTWLCPAASGQLLWLMAALTQQTSPSSYVQHALM